MLWHVYYIYSHPHEDITHEVLAFLKAMFYSGNRQFQEGMNAVFNTSEATTQKALWVQGLQWLPSPARLQVDEGYSYLEIHYTYMYLAPQCYLSSRTPLQPLVEYMYIINFLIYVIQSPTLADAMNPRPLIMRSSI